MALIETHGLRKSFKLGRSVVEAVRGVDLRVEEGEIFGFLGPNGAGKTTTLRILTTLLPPDGGRAIVAGYDVEREPGRVRECIGYVSQIGGVDGNATGRENLLLQAQLYRIPQPHARTTELLTALELTSSADRLASTYSGGQKRRLSLAMGLVHKPRILFLDEPTIGLDPQSRAWLWNEVRNLRSTGTTIFLTTHYLEEADVLCDRLAIIDGGTIVAEGTPTALKRSVAHDVISLGLAIAPYAVVNDALASSFAQTTERMRLTSSSTDRAEVPSTMQQIRSTSDHALQNAHDLLRTQPFVYKVHQEKDTLRLYVEHGEQQLPSIIQLLSDAQISLQTISLSHPTLDDVFLSLTGRTLRDAELATEQQAASSPWAAKKQAATRS